MSTENNDRNYQELLQIFDDLENLNPIKKQSITELISYYIKSFIKHNTLLNTNLKEVKK